MENEHLIKAVNELKDKQKVKRKKDDSSNVIAIIISIFFLTVIYYLYEKNELIEDFSKNKTLICKNSLVSKEFGYIYNENEESFVSKKDQLIFPVEKCKLLDVSN